MVNRLLIKLMQMMLLILLPSHLEHSMLLILVQLLVILEARIWELDLVNGLILLWVFALQVTLARIVIPLLNMPMIMTSYLSRFVQEDISTSSLIHLHYKAAMSLLVSVPICLQGLRQDSPWIRIGILMSIIAHTMPSEQVCSSVTILMRTIHCMQSLVIRLVKTCSL